MKLIYIPTLFILFTGCEKTVQRRPYKVGICVQERSRFMASFSKEAFETYKFKTMTKNGYYTFRYNLKGSPEYYRWMSFEDVKNRDFKTVDCPDQKELKLFKMDE